MTPFLLETRNLRKSHALPRASLFGPRRRLMAVDDVSLTISAGESLGLVGESGSGKSTLARLVMALEPPDAGTVLFEGDNLLALSAAALRARRRFFQMIFQDPNGSLDPRLSVARIVAEPLTIAEPHLTASERHERVVEALREVGLGQDASARYPHEFSGGQRQRIALARALITRPRLIVADEPVSALDVSIQAQVLNLMTELQARHGVTYLFISHNLAVVEHVADQVAVMYRGSIVEIGRTGAVFADPAHPYTRALIDAVPRLEAARGEPLQGAVTASPIHSTDSPTADACAYAPRCPRAAARCRMERPMLTEVAVGGQQAACHFPFTRNTG
jgi:peptide/nickel transport system ATP-binding protein